MTPKTASIALISVFGAALALSGCKDDPACPAVKADPPAQAAASSAAPPAAVAPKSVPATVAAADAKTAHADDTLEPSVKDPHGDIDIDADLKVKRLVLARGVEAREPVSPATTFTKTEAARIYAFVEIGNADAAESEIFVSFRPAGGKEGGPIRLHVGASPRWRTWAVTQKAQSTGNWEVIVRNARGDIIGKQSFSVIDTSADPYAEIDVEDPARRPHI